MNPMYESVEIKQVWKPEKQYAVNDEPVDGYWREFFRGDKPVGVLYTDGTTSLDFRGGAGEGDLVVKVGQLIQMCADMGYSAKSGFESVSILLQEQDGLTYKHDFGIVPPQIDDGETTYSVSVKDDKEVVALVKLEGEKVQLRIDGEWEDAASGDPRVENIPFVDVSQDAVILWDDSNTNIEDYSGVRLDEQ